MRPRVSLFTPFLHMGGSERWLVDLARHLDRTRIDYLGAGVAILRGGAGVPSPAIHPTMLHHAMAAGPVILGPAGCADLARRSDVAIYWGMEYPPIPKSPRIVFVSHGTNGWTRHLARLAEKRGHVLAAVSSAAAQVFCRPTQVAVLPNGVNLGRCRPMLGRVEMRRRWGLAEDRIALAYIGRIAPNKGCHAPAEAAAVLGEPYVPVYVGPVYDQKTASQISRIHPKARFFDAVDHVGDALAAVDCFLLASPSEGFALALIEAWASGVPTVATAVGAVPESEERHGPLTVRVPVQATGRQLADAVLEAMSSANKPVVERAARVARAEYSGQAMGRRWTEFILRICGGVPGGPAHFVRR